MLQIQGVTDCSPAEVGYDASRIGVLNAHFEKLIEDNKLQAASYCASRYGKTFMHGAIGPLSYREDRPEPLLPTTVHNIASITKAVTSVAVAKLVEDGIFRFNTPVGDILEPFKVAPFDKIDIYSLLTHTSGMFPDCAESLVPYHKSYWQVIDEFFEKYTPEDGEPDWIKAALSCGLNKQPGEEWQYCSFGFCLLGEVIKKVTGITAEQYIEEQILKPLGMKDTAWELTPELARRAIIRNERHEKRLNDIVDGKQPEYSQAEKLWDTVSRTGGGLISTPADLLRFANMLLGMGTLEGTRIIGRKAVEKITTRTLYGIPDHCWGANERDRSYGIGLDMRRGPAYLYSETTYFHEGAGACCMVIDPTEQLAAVWFVPFTGDNWYAEGLYNVTNIIWSGLT
ncbi:Putative D-alanyl-D-alanine carboxypeptidase [Paenibacillus auburnensis]|uniref:D-alanyl-D-alanine carboxypeptidase n=1 Tax=Paenibacillus auburnensis TaxID=2905649 RepID=A0ABM9C5G4_9BACL|nr:serine hydrolase domain-containing protein [Paenibacillus auburnensis]CAH1204573.1 Putative D-alanyl-D-alanine carboxypeptidase [Paenibacillus auburnensis]